MLKNTWKPAWVEALITAVFLIVVLSASVIIFLHTGAAGLKPGAPIPAVVLTNIIFFAMVAPRRIFHKGRFVTSGVRYIAFLSCRFLRANRSLKPSLLYFDDMGVVHFKRQKNGYSFGI